MLTLLKTIKLMTGGGYAAAPWLISLLALGVSFRGPSASTKTKGASQPDATFKTITAEQIVMVDKKGQKRIEMSDSDINLYDSKGICRASVNVSGTGGFGVFSLWGNDKRPLASFIGRSDGSVQLLIGDSDKEAVWLNKNSMQFWQKGVRTIELSAESDYPNLHIRDKAGQARAVLGLINDDGADENSLPYLFFNDSHKRLRVGIGSVAGTKVQAEKNGQLGGSIMLFDTDRKPIWHAP